MVDRVETDVSPFKPGGRFVEEDGTLTGDGYRFLDQIWKRTGGFTDGAWDSSAIAESLQTQISELNTTVEGLLANRGFEDDSRAIDLLQRIEALEAGLVDTSDQAEAALRQALNIDDPNVVNGAIKTRSLGANAASVIASATDAVSSDITSGTGPAKRTNSITISLSADLGPEVLPGAEVAVFVDFEHVIETAAFNWVVMSHNLIRHDIGNPSGNATSLRESLWVQGGDAGNVDSLPNSILGNDLSFPHNWIYVNTLPDVGDADYNAAGYTYRSEVKVSTAWDDGSTMIDGYDTPNTNSSSHRLEDWQVLVFQLKR